ncbi:alginate export family protein [soil metagenome]
MYTSLQKRLMKIILTWALLLSNFYSQSQINTLRYNDNFTNLKNDSVQKVGFDNLKYIPLTENTNISLGGEIRSQFQYYSNQNFGDVPSTFNKVSSGQIWQRIMVHLNLELGNKLRVFTQMASTSRFLNPNPLIPEIDENQLSLHQAFLDYTFNKNWKARIGRQEISYGNNRIITFRDGPNTRLTFDAAIFKFNSEKRKFDLFLLTPVISMPGVLDDKSFKDLIVGVHSTRTIKTNRLIADFYSLSFLSNRRKYNYVAGKESRQSLGTRVYSQNPKLNYELEITYQYGTFNELKINAYGIYLDINYKIDTKFKFLLGLASNYNSGDRNKNDRQLNTYNLIFSKPQYGMTAPIGSSNIVAINPYLKINPTEKINLYAGVYLMWRQSNQDGTYSPISIEVRPTPVSLFNSTKKDIGVQLSTEANYMVNKNLSLGYEVAYFFAGKYVKETGNGKNITYTSFKVGYKF